MIMRNLFLTAFVSFNTILIAASENEHHEANWLDSWIIPNPGIFLWTLVTFLIVLIILKAKAWAPLIAALDKRESDIRESLNAAEKAREDAENITKDYEKMVQKAKKESVEIISASREAGEKVKTEIITEVTEDTDETDEIEKDEDQLWDEINDEPSAHYEKWENLREHISGIGDIEGSRYMEIADENEYNAFYQSYENHPDFGEEYTNFLNKYSEIFNNEDLDREDLAALFFNNDDLSDDFKDYILRQMAP